MTPADFITFAKKQPAAQLAAVDRALNRAAAKGAKMARDRTVAVHAVDTGDFKNSWGTERRPDGMALVNTSDHAAGADDGRPPGEAPPLIALVRWVERKFNIGGPAAWGIARKISENIAARGIEGAHVLEWVSARLESTIIPDEIEKELNR